MPGPGFPPLIAGYHQGKRPRVMWDRSLDHRFPCGMRGGGWSLFDTFDTEGVFGSGAVLALRPATTSQSLAEFSLDLPSNETDTYTASGRVVLARLRVQYRRPSGDDLTVRLLAVHKTTGVGTVVDSWVSSGGSPDFPVQAGSFTQVQFATLHTLTPGTHNYVLSVSMTAAATGGTSVAVGTMDYDLRTTGLLAS